MRYTGTQRVFVIGQQLVVARTAKEVGPLAMELPADLLVRVISPDAAYDPDILPKEWFLVMDEAAGKCLLQAPAAVIAQFFEGRTRVELTLPPLDPTFDPETGGRRAAPT